MAFVVETGGSAFGLRVLAVVLLVPDDPADIQLVVEDAGLAFAVAANGVVAPVFVLRGGNAAGVQALRNCGRADPVGILLEDPAHNLCLGRFDLAQALIRSPFASRCWPSR